MWEENEGEEKEIEKDLKRIPGTDQEQVRRSDEEKERERERERERSRK
jgi:hypothetical protein